MELENLLDDLDIQITFGTSALRKHAEQDEQESLGLPLIEWCTIDGMYVDRRQKVFCV
jgi:hypothetical protein